MALIFFFSTGIISSLFLLVLSAEFYVGDLCTRHDGEPGVCKPVMECVGWMQQNKIVPNQLSRCSFEGSVVVLCCQGKAVKTSQAPKLNCYELLLIPDTLEECKKLHDGFETRLDRINGMHRGEHARSACTKILEKKTLSLEFQVFGGEAASLGEFPHMAALGYVSEKSGEDYDFRCGGALITATHILTAAHCSTKTDRPVIARLGTVDLLRKDLETIQDCRILKWKQHPEFDFAKKIHDIAILTIEAADISDPGSVFPICIDVREVPPIPDSQATVCGYGRTEAGQGSNELLKTDLTVITNERCGQIYSDSVRFSGFIEGQFCAWDPEFKKDACEGDSGGPVHQKINSSDYLIGVISYGPKKCASNLPGVYTLISTYMEWIENQVWN